MRFRLFLRSILAYRNHPARRDLPDPPEIWHQGTTKLRDFAPDLAPNAPRLLVIPSLINRYHVLDLDKNGSLLRWLATQGIRPLLVDWSDPGQNEQSFGFENYLRHRLIPILTHLRTTSDAPLHLLGYCMGGLLALALAAKNRDCFASLTLMATPWDFHRPDPTAAARAALLANELAPLLQTGRMLPVDSLQALFATHHPGQVLDKFIAFAALPPDSAEARQFVLLEDWLNDGVPLPAPAAQAILRDWYGENHTAQGRWHIGATLIDPATLTLPGLVIAPQRDRIVPPESAQALARSLPHARLLTPDLGHVGMIVSQSARRTVWTKIAEHLKIHR